MTIRRSRRKRTSTGKHLELTARDLAIFGILSRYRFLRSSYLHTFVGGASEKRFKERLGDLFHEGYLDRPNEQWRFADARYRAVVHELGKGGREVLAASTIEAPPVTWLRDGPHRQFEHSVLICEVLASFELATRCRNDIRFIPWAEILAKSPEATRSSPIPFRFSTPTLPNGLIPDGLFGLEYIYEGKRMYRFFALEADRGTMPIVRAGDTGTSICGKMAAYRGLMEQGTFRQTHGIPKLLVLFVAMNETRCDEMIKRCSASGGDGRSFLFRPFSGAVFPDLSFLSAPWLRPNAPPLCLDDQGPLARSGRALNTGLQRADGHQ